MPLIKDAFGNVIQGFAPEPSRVLVPINLNGTKVFKKGAGGDYDITGWVAISITPSTANLTRFLNDDSTKTRTIFGGQENVILIGPNTKKITISGTDASVEVEGM